jgi:hypothetical protein
VDEFGIKLYNDEDKTHLLSALKEHYKFTVDHDGRNYCGMQLDWNYRHQYVDVSMPGYNLKALQRLQHQKPKRPQYPPHAWNKPVYGKSQQLAPEPDTTELLNDDASKKYIQSAVGSYLYYGRAIEHTMLPALNEIGSTQSKPTLRRLCAYIPKCKNKILCQ